MSHRVVEAMSFAPASSWEQVVRKATDMASEARSRALSKSVAEEGSVSNIYLSLKSRVPDRNHRSRLVPIVSASIAAFGPALPIYLDAERHSWRARICNETLGIKRP